MLAWNAGFRRAWDGRAWGWGSPVNENDIPEQVDQGRRASRAFAEAAMKVDSF
jgi:hypothetical protein